MTGKRYPEGTRFVCTGKYCKHTDGHDPPIQCNEHRNAPMRGVDDDEGRFFYSGNEYWEVSKLLHIFRTDKLYKGWGLDTTEVRYDGTRTCFVAKIYDDILGSKPRASGTSEKPRGKDKYDGALFTSLIEKVETNAIGRALRNLGIGPKHASGISSADELLEALVMQGKGSDGDQPPTEDPAPIPDRPVGPEPPAPEAARPGGFTVNRTNFVAEAWSPNGKTVSVVIRDRSENEMTSETGFADGAEAREWANAMLSTFERRLQADEAAKGSGDGGAVEA